MYDRYVSGSVAWGFLLKRLIRLTPPYYFSILLILVLFAVKQRLRPGDATPPSWQDVGAHLFYLQDFMGVPSLNIVYWTLVVEIQFYVMFALMMVCADALKRITNWSFSRMLVGGASAAISLPWALSWLTTPLWPGGFIGFWYCFMLGVLAHWHARKQPAATLVLFVVLALLTLSSLKSPSATVIVAIVTTVFVLLANYSHHIRELLSWKLVQFVGLISYSLYLVHNQIQGAVAFALRKVMNPSLATDVVLFAALILAPVLAAWMTYQLIEKPSIRWSRTVGAAGQPRGVQA
jgi:peptidoglycan/LPS O-acetylase OafA/YrhL